MTNDSAEVENDDATFQVHHHDYWSSWVACAAVSEQGWVHVCQCCGPQGENHGFRSEAHAIGHWRARGWLIEGDRALCPHHLGGVVPDVELMTKCPLCDHRDWSVDTHCRKVHHMTYDGAFDIGRGATPHSCESCDFIAASRRGLSLHARTHRDVTA